jgi:HEAT repeat protein
MTLHALGRLGGERAEAAIRPFLANADDDIRKAAQQALVLIETQSA